MYGKPGIEGKGGACFDEMGNTYTTEMIAGQEVQVCEIDGFRIEYFTHPSKEIEYWINTQGLSGEELGVIKKAVRETFQFEN